MEKVALNFLEVFFAIVIYNKKKNYFVAVDRLGIKQIYYHYSKKKSFNSYIRLFSFSKKINTLELKIDKVVLMNFVCLAEYLENKQFIKISFFV